MDVVGYCVALACILVAAMPNCLDATTVDPATVAFPPVRPSRPYGSPLPVGHEMQLGYQRESDGPVTEYTEVSQHGIRASLLWLCGRRRCYQPSMIHDNNYYTVFPQV